MSMIPWDQPRGAVHNVEHLYELSAERNNLLCVSDRTLYILQNYAAQDVNFPTRYSISRTDHGYEAIREDSGLWPTWQEVVRNFKLEVEDMSCDVVEALNEIRDAINALTVAQQTGASAICCYDPTEGEYYDEDPGEGEPEDLCHLAYSYALYWETGANEFYHQWALGAFPSLGILQAIFEEFNIPGGDLLELITLGATEALPMLESLWQLTTGNLVLPITCAIYNASGSAGAKDTIDSIIEGIGGINETATALLKGPITYSGLNRVYDGSFPPSSLEGPDCEEICGQEQCAGPMFFPTCDPNNEGPCGYGDLSPGTGRTWVAAHDASNGSYAIYAVLDTNRELTVSSIEGWTEKEGQPPCRWYGCQGGSTVLLGEIDDPGDFPTETCAGWLVVIGATPFSMTVDIGDPCEPDWPE